MTDIKWDKDKLEKACIATQEWLADGLEDMTKEDWDEMFGEGAWEEDFGESN